MQKWDHDFAEAEYTEDNVYAVLKMYETTGWELISTNFFGSNVIFFFKRPIKD